MLNFYRFEVKHRGEVNHIVGVHGATRKEAKEQAQATERRGYRVGKCVSVVYADPA